MATLKTNYKDDVLDTSKNTKRKYNMINNADGTVSLEDVTSYTQIGDKFGAGDINGTNKEINALNTSLNQVSTYVGDDKKLHFRDAKGVDNILPFSSGVNLNEAIYSLHIASSWTVTRNSGNSTKMIVIGENNGATSVSLTVKKGSTTLTPIKSGKCFLDGGTTADNSSAYAVYELEKNASYDITFTANASSYHYMSIMMCE